MFYITGDCHGEYYNIESFYNRKHPKTTDTIILLGDSGINYYYPDNECKNTLYKIPMNYFIIHGNHDNYRPDKLKTYQEVEYCGGIVYKEEEFPTIRIAKFGEIYNLPDYTGKDKKCIVLDGAYSVDKWYRLRNGWGWWNDEQPTDEMKEYAIKQLEKNNWEVDYVLSHTCPIDFEPTELFLPMLDQSTVDNSYEKWLQNEIYNKLKYNNVWYFGHFHDDKFISNKMLMMFKNIDKFGELCI